MERIAVTFLIILIADNFLFAQNYIADASNDTMQNGSGINLSAFTSYASEGLFIPQSSLILNMQGNDSLFDMFHSTWDNWYDYGNNTTGLRGIITDPNGHPLNNVLVEIVDYPEAGQLLLKSTGVNGKFIFKKINAEKCTVRVRKNKYTIAEYEVILEKDNFKEFNIVLMAEPVPQPVNA